MTTSSAEPEKKKTIKELAAEHTDDALDALANILKSEKSSDMARIQAATALLDRGHGKPTQFVEQTTKIQTLSDLLKDIGLREKKYQDVVEAQVTVVEPLELPPPKALTWEDVL